MYERIIGTLVAQLVQQLDDSDVFDSEVLTLFGRHEKTRSYPSYEELIGILDKLSESFSTVFIVIDALNEFAGKNDIVSFFRDLAAGEWYCKFKVFVASRPEVDLQQALAAFRRLIITPADIAPDIERYVRTRVAQFRWHDIAELDDIVQHLVSRANGM